MEQAECGPAPQIEQDLSPFTEVNFDDVLREAKARYHQPAAKSFCHYVIKDNEVWMEVLGIYLVIEGEGCESAECKLYK